MWWLVERERMRVCVRLVLPSSVYCTSQADNQT